MEYVIANSFSQFQHELELPVLAAELLALEKDNASLTEESDEMTQEYLGLRQVRGLHHLLFCGRANLTLFFSCVGIGANGVFFA